MAESGKGPKVRDFAYPEGSTLHSGTQAENVKASPLSDRGRDKSIKPRTTVQAGNRVRQGGSRLKNCFGTSSGLGSDETHQSMEELMSRTSLKEVSINAAAPKVRPTS